MKPVETRDSVVRRQAEGPGLQLSRVLQAPRPLAGGGRCWGVPPAVAFLEDCYLNRQELGVGAPGGGPEP